MGTSIVRYLENNTQTPQWGVLSRKGINKLDLEMKGHRDLMLLYFHDRASFDSSLSANSVDPGSIKFLSPLSNDIQLFAQGLNYASHRAESGVKVDAEKEENLIFYKAGSSLTGPNHDIIRPRDCRLLDYEIELGVVLKTDIHKPTDVPESELGNYIGALVLCNDVSARDFMFGAPMLQWFKGKSQRTFCPAGPVLYLLDDGDEEEIYSLELTLKLNGEIKQQATTDQLIHKPAKTLHDISRFSDMNAGDCILTGTPGGVLAGNSLKVGLSVLLNFTNDAKRREKFTQAQLALTRFLEPGDILELSIVSKDGSIDLGTQTNQIRDTQV